MARANALGACKAPLCLETACPEGCVFPRGRCAHALPCRYLAGRAAFILVRMASLLGFLNGSPRLAFQDCEAIRAALPPAAVVLVLHARSSTSHSSM